MAYDDSILHRDEPCEEFVRSLQAATQDLTRHTGAKGYVQRLDMKLSLGRIQTALLGSALMLTNGVFGQLGGPGGPAGLTATITKLFGDNRAFTAKAEVQLLDGSQKEVALMPMDFSLLDKSIRVEMDLTQVKNQEMQPGVAESLKKMGMARVVSIINPVKKTAYVLYPDQKVLLSLPLPKEPDQAANSEVKKTASGKETIDGHPCVKNKVTVTDDAGQPIEVLLWNATDLKDFPIQIQTKEQENTSVMRFKQVQFSAPDAALFEAPADYIRCTNKEELMQAVLKNAAPKEQK